MLPGTVSLLIVPTILYRLRLDIGVRVITRQYSFGDLTFEQTLDVPQQLVLIHAYQGNRFSLIAGSTGTADPVYVIFRYVWQFIVHHMG